MSGQEVGAMDAVDALSPRAEEDQVCNSANSHQTPRDAPLGTINEETDYPRLPSSPEHRNVKKTPSYRGSAK